MRKKYLLFVLVLLCLLTACSTGGKNENPDLEVEVGSQNEGNDEGKMEVVVGNPSTEPTKEPVGEPTPTNTPELTPTNTPVPTNPPTPTNTPIPTPVPFVEVVVADNAEYVIKITDCSYDRYGGCNLKVYLENKSDNIQYRFGLETVSVNGVQCYAYFGEYVSAGRKANKTLSISDSMLTDAGIVDFTDIELVFDVYDANNWSSDTAYETAHIYPKGEENAISYVREAKEDDVVLMDNEYATVILTGYKKSNIWGDTMDLFIVNKAEESLTFTAEDASINGVMSSPYWAYTLGEGKCTYSSMSWWDDVLYKNNIKEFNVFEFTLRAYNHNWIDGDIANEIIRVYPNGAESAKLYEREITDTDIVLVDNENMSIVITGFEEDKEDGYFYAHMFLTNKTDKVLGFTAKDVSVNGFMVDPYFYESVAAGKSAFTYMSWDEDDLKENAIEKVYDIEMIFYIDNADNWREVYFEESVTVEVAKDESGGSQKEDPNAKVVIDNEECTVKITKINPMDEDGYTIYMMFENKSEDKTYTLSLMNAAVNGVQIDAYMSCEVLPGKKANDEIEITDEILGENGIVDFTDIELLLRVYDSNDWFADDVAEETVHVYPNGAESVKKHVHEVKSTDSVIVDNEYVRVIATDMSLEKDGDYIIGFYLENKTNNEVYFTSEGDAVNGYEVDASFYTTLLSNLCTYTEMEFDSDDLNENDISSIEEVEFILKIRDNNDWFADPYYEDTVKLVP